VPKKKKAAKRARGMRARGPASVQWKLTQGKQSAGSQTASAEPSPASTTPGSNEVPLEDVMIALQKTFSRVSSESGLVPEGQARALVVGQVQFTLRLRANLALPDHLVQSPDGVMEFTFSGQIDTDIRPKEPASEESN
jgi:hypothetical protein